MTPSVCMWWPMEWEGTGAGSVITLDETATLRGGELLPIMPMRLALLLLALLPALPLTACFDSERRFS